MRRTMVMLLALLMATSVYAGKDAKNQRSTVCQIVDVPFDPVVELSGSFIQSSALENNGDVSMTEIGGHWAFAHFWDVLFGDVDVMLRLNSTILSESAGADLPSQLSRVAIDAGWTGRFSDGYSLQARILPGIYNDFREFGGDALYMPVSLAVIKAFDSKLSGIFGVEVRPGFDQQIMPLIGVGCMLNDRTRLDARLPESRIVYYLGRGWSTHAGFIWQNMSYGIHPDDAGVNQMTVEDVRLFCGTTFRLSDNLQLSGEVGRVLGRTIAYENTDNNAGGKFDLEDAMLVRFTFGGPF